MKTFRSRGGPFLEQLFYSEAEIERTCTEALIDVDLLPKEPGAIRIDRFIEKRFGVAVEYDDLGPGVLGYTRFGKAGVTAVVVSKALDLEGTEVAERRVRSTVAHEAGHGLFHAHLFLATGQCDLLPEGKASRPRVLCRDERKEARPGYRGSWWEYQANQAIGALLLPRGLATRALAAFVTTGGLLGIPHLPATSRAEAIRHLAKTFDVNKVVARIRLEQLYPESGSEQPSL